MGQEPDVEKVAGELQVSIGLLRRRARQLQADGELTLPETSALARLDRGGPMTATALAKLEQISPQSMGATLGALEERALIERRPDPADGRRAVVTITRTGLQLLQNRRNARTRLFADALSTGFTRAELKQLMAAAPLIERLAQSI
jgi:DNA-binding MarR family transcriptional regulator